MDAVLQQLRAHKAETEDAQRQLEEERQKRVVLVEAVAAGQAQVGAAQAEVQALKASVQQLTVQLQECVRALLCSCSSTAAHVLTRRLAAGKERAEAAAQEAKAAAAQGTQRATQLQDELSRTSSGFAGAMAALCADAGALFDADRPEDRAGDVGAALTAWRQACADAVPRVAAQREGAPRAGDQGDSSVVAALLAAWQRATLQSDAARNAGAVVASHMTEILAVLAKAAPEAALEQLLRLQHASRRNAAAVRTALDAALPALDAAVGATPLPDSVLRSLRERHLQPAWEGGTPSDTQHAVLDAAMLALPPQALNAARSAVPPPPREEAEQRLAQLAAAVVAKPPSAPSSTASSPAAPPGRKRRREGGEAEG